MKKRLISLLLVIVMLCTIMPQAFAAEGSEDVLTGSTINLGDTFKSLNGSFDSISFADKDGNPVVVKATITTSGSTIDINVTTPRDHLGLTGKIVATLHLIQSETVKSPDAQKAMPLVSGSRHGSGWDDTGYVRTTITNTLSEGTTNNKSLCYYDYDESGAIVKKFFNLYYTAENNTPELVGDSAATVSIKAGETYTVNLAPLFKDKDTDDTLTYKVNNGKAFSTTTYAYTPTVGGTYVLEIYAYDAIKSESPLYTLTVNVSNSEETFPVAVTVPEGSAPKFYYTAEAREDSELTPSIEGNVYTLSVPKNIKEISWREDGIGAKTTVSAEDSSKNSFTLVKTSYTAKVDGEIDTAATITVTNAVGKDGAYLLSTSDKYTVSAKPSSNYSAGYKETKLSNYTPVSGNVDINLDTKEIKFTYPSTSWGAPSHTLTISELPTRQGNAAKVVEPKTTGSHNMMSRTRTDTYLLQNGKVYEYRVTSTADTDVTYVGVFEKTAKTPETFSITATQLADGDNGRTTIDHELDKETIGSLDSANYADIYLTNTAQGYIDLDVGGTKNLIAVRAWWATSTGGWALGTKHFVEPEFHYTVVGLDGAASSDIIEVSADGTITAKAEGTAIVLVTYDAMNVNFDPALYQGTEAPRPNGFYGAIWPENTGVLVVSVGAGESGIDTGMTINTDKDNSVKTIGNKLDADLDVIYFLGEQGEYSFTPGTEGVTVSVANPTITENVLGFSGFIAVTANEDGSFSVPLTTGRNIVKIEKDGKATYQVITAKSVNVTVNGTSLSDAMLAPGDDVSIVFDTLYDPLKRMGMYNVSTATVYSNVSGYEGKTAGAGRGPYGYYFYAANAGCQTIDSFNEESTDSSGYNNKIVTLTDKLTVPTDFTADYFTLSNGTFNVGGFSHYKMGDWRTVLGVPGDVSGNSANIVGYLGKLPDISIPVASLDDISVTTDPSKTEYAIGEAFDPAGMVVEASFTHANNTVTRTVTDFTYDTAAFTEAGSKTVTISYKVGTVVKTADVNVNVTETTLERIELSTAPSKTFYNVGDAFDPTGMVITAFYSDDINHAVSNYTCSPSVLSASDTAVTVTYGSKTVEVPVTMNVVTSISVTTAPTKTDYVAGEYFNALGMVVTATYADGNSVATESYRYAPLTALVAGTEFITITYTGADASPNLSTARQAITVTPASGPATDDFITVSMSFVDQGSIVVYNVPVTIYASDTNGEYTIADAFRALHKEYCPAGTSGYAEISNTELTGWVTKFWNGGIDTFSYTYNNGWVESTKQKIKNNDRIAAYNGYGEQYCDLFTWFDSETYTAVVGTAKHFTVNGLNIMNSTATYELTAFPVGATVKVFNADNGTELTALGTTVGANGTFVISFTESGTYSVEVAGFTDYAHFTDAPVVPSRCIVTVYESNGSSSEDGDETEDETTGSTFTDVKKSDYFYNAVKWAIEKGITDGTSDTTFSPHASCTRAQMVTFLWRAAGQPKASNSARRFSDMDSSAYYYDAVLWAIEKGITDGTSDTTFSPDAICTREQTAAFLYRFSGSPAANGGKSFADVPAESIFSSAISWAAANGITDGTSDTTFSPAVNCSRAQIVTMLYRLLGDK